jgi:hypothetical protein
VLSNGAKSPTFKTSRGLIQGDPKPPLPFNIVIDGFTKMLAKTTERRLTIGLLEQFRSGGIVTLQYVDDNLLFSTSDDRVIRNLKCVLLLFE